MKKMKKEKKLAKYGKAGYNRAMSFFTFFTIEKKYKEIGRRITLASDGERLTGLWLEGQKYFGGGAEAGVGAGAGAGAQRDLPVFQAVREWLDRYFAGERPESPSEKIPLAPAGSAFRQAVWNVLLTKIPYGQTMTYGEVARQAARLLGRPRLSSRAVGGAVGHNPISIIIPCHRVVGADGSLTGYAGGLAVKKRLLELEGMSRPFLPREEN